MSAFSRSTTIVFSSSLPVEVRSDVERLMFFNRNQGKMQEGIKRLAERYGHPRLIVDPVKQRLGLRVGSAKIATQTLFVSARGRGRDRPVGALIFTRQEDVLAALYLAVHEDYCARGPHSDVQLLVRMIKEFESIGRRVRGVAWLDLYLGGTKPVRKRVRRPARDAA